MKFRTTKPEGEEIKLLELEEDEGGCVLKMNKQIIATFNDSFQHLVIWKKYIQTKGVNVEVRE